MNGRPHIVKYFDNPDWLADAARDDTCRSVGLFESGLYDDVSGIVDSTVVGAARLGRDGAPWPAALLMRDVGDDFVPLDGAVDLDTHAAFLDAMAALHARYWNAPPVLDYMPLDRAYLFLSPRQVVEERDERGDRSDVLRVVLPGWAAVAEERPGLWSSIAHLVHEPTPLVDALRRTPATFVHGDWKMGNLGRRSDGRVILVDWDRPHVGPGLADLGWYLAVNCDRLPEPKEACLERYRGGLEGAGIATEPWWDDQVDLSLLGAFLQLGWSKAGQPDELSWWEAAVHRGLRRL